MSGVPWREIIRGALDLASIVLGAVLADRQKPAAPTQSPASPPRSRPPASFPARADNEITPTGHANIDARFRTVPPPAPPAPATITERAPAPLPGSALRGEVPVDPDATEPEVPLAIARRGTQ